MPHLREFSADSPWLHACREVPQAWHRPSPRAIFDPCRDRITSLVDTGVSTNDRVTSLIDSSIPRDSSLPDRDRALSFDANREFHLAQVAASANPHLARFAEVLWTSSVYGTYEDDDATPEEIAEWAEAHQAILDAIVAGDGGRALHLTRLLRGLMLERSFPAFKPENPGNAPARFEICRPPGPRASVGGPGRPNYPGGEAAVRACWRNDLHIDEPCGRIRRRSLAAHLADIFRTINDLPARPTTFGRA